MATDPFLSFEAALPSIIAESPSTVTRYREHMDDTFRRVTEVYTVGPDTVRIEPFKAATVQDIWDEKGGVAHLLFQMIGYNLAATVEHEGVVQPRYRLNDKVVDQYGNEYRVAAPQYVRGKLLQVTLELRG